LIKNGCLTTAVMRVKLEGPVFIGDGTSVTKKEYYYNAAAGTVSFYQMARLQQILVRMRMTDAYVQYLLNPNQRSLGDFFKVNGIKPEQLDEALLYTVPAGDAIGTDGQPAEIARFFRTPDGQVCFPGSSAKGALRTALLTGIVLQERTTTKKPTAPEGTNSRENMRAIKNDAKYCTLESDCLHTLNINKNKSNPVNSLMRGIMVSDCYLGRPQMVLCRKHDLDPHGGLHSINTIRECLPPGMTVNFPITIDDSLSGGVTFETLKKAVGIFDRFYCKSILSQYAMPENCPAIELNSHLFFGGGSGYQSKTVALPWLGEKDGLHYVSALMCAQFPQGHHDDDERQGRSPHTLKFTSIHQRHLPFGLCEVEFV